MDRREWESNHFIAYTSKDSIKPYEVDASDHESLVQSVNDESVGTFDHGGPFPDMPDWVEKWDHFNTKTSNSCGSGYSEHYMVGLTFETKGPVSSYAGPALGGAIGAALGSVIPGAGNTVGGAIGAMIGGVVGAVIAQGYDTNFLTVAWADHDTGPWWATVPTLTVQYRGKWNYQRPNHMYPTGTSPGMHVSPIASHF